MTVASLISSAQGYAGSAVSNAQTALDDAKNLVAAVGYVIPNFYPVALPSQPPASLDIVAPTLDTVTLDLPAEPENTLSFQDIPALDSSGLPVLVATPPVITLPTTPSQLAAFLDSAPAIDTNIVFPEPPSALINPLIADPVLPDRAAPIAPNVALPTFDALVPTDNTAAPTDLEGSFRSAYQGAAPSTIAMLDGYVDAQMKKYNPKYHEQMERIESQLATYLAGGTGLNPAAENAIYERARGKNDAEARRVRSVAFSDVAERGFTLPNGALASAIQQARQDSANINAKASSEIVVMQAEMEQKNLQFAVTTSANLRTSMLSAALNYHQNLVSINGQALDYAKSILSAIVEAYNVAVKAFTVKLDAYRAEAAVYDTRLKSAMAGIELYRVEIAALEALTNVDKAKVDVYRARIDALTSLSNVYRAQIEAVVGRTSLEKLKLEVFQARVQAYTAQVQGKNSEYQGFAAAIEGQTARAKIYATQVDAYTASVQGYKTGIDAKVKVLEAVALSNKARAEQYAATLSGYNAVVSARGEKARTVLENQRQSIVAFQASASARVANAQVRNEYYKSVSIVAIENAKLQMSAQVQTADSTRAFGASIAQLGVGSAQVYSSLASAAMSGMNSLASELKNE